MMAATTSRKHSPMSLFMKENQTPVFTVVNIDAKSESNNRPSKELCDILAAIQLAGGKNVQNPLVETEYSIPILYLSRNDRLNRSVIKDLYKNLKVHGVLRDLFHENFIWDLSRWDAVPDLNNYLIGRSVFHPYDANDILLKRKKWSDLKLREADSVQKNDYPTRSKSKSVEVQSASIDSDPGTSRQRISAPPAASVLETRAPVSTAVSTDLDDIPASPPRTSRNRNSRILRKRAADSASNELRGNIPNHSEYDDFPGSSLTPTKSPVTKNKSAIRNVPDKSPSKKPSNSKETDTLKSVGSVESEGRPASKRKPSVALQTSETPKSGSSKPSEKSPDSSKPTTSEEHNRPRTSTGSSGTENTAVTERLSGESAKNLTLNQTRLRTSGTGLMNSVRSLVNAASNPIESPYISQTPGVPDSAQAGPNRNRSSRADQIDNSQTPTTSRPRKSNQNETGPSSAAVSGNKDRARVEREITPFSDSDNDMADIIFSAGPRKAPARPPKRPPKKIFRREEQQKMLDWVIQRRGFDEIFSKELYVTMEKANICPTRTWQSLSNNFRKSVVTNLQKFQIKEEDKKKFIRRLKMCGKYY